jgi:ABC-type lipoprotein export system ATPase subunit
VTEARPSPAAASTSETARPVVTASGVTRIYRGLGPDVTAVRNASWELGHGMRVAVTGPSGSGKSTLLYLMAGFDTPTSGSIRWRAMVEDPQAHPLKVGFVFQGANLIPNLDVGENIALPMLFAGIDETVAASRAGDAAAALRIADVITKLPQELSGGQAQRVAVARALAAEPALILADEPTGQLDHDSAAEVVEVLLQACTRTGAALVVATHDPLVAGRLPHQWTMRDGFLETDAPLEQVRA